MIQNINTYTGQWLNVNYSKNNPYFSNSMLSAGQLRYNPGNSCVEVYDGSSWFTFSGHAEVSLTPQAQKIMEWAEAKMAAEEKLADMLERHPGLKESWERFEIMKQLCLEQELNEKS